MSRVRFYRKSTTWFWERLRERGNDCEDPSIEMRIKSRLNTTLLGCCLQLSAPFRDDCCIKRYFVNLQWKNVPLPILFLVRKKFHHESTGFLLLLEFVLRVIWGGRSAVSVQPEIKPNWPASEASAQLTEPGVLFLVFLQKAEGLCWNATVRDDCENQVQWEEDLIETYCSCFSDIVRWVPKNFVLFFLCRAAAYSEKCLCLLCMFIVNISLPRSKQLVLSIPEVALYLIKLPFVFRFEVQHKSVFLLDYLLWSRKWRMSGNRVAPYLEKPYRQWLLTFPNPGTSIPGDMGLWTPRHQLFH